MISLLRFICTLGICSSLFIVTQANDSYSDTFRLKDFTIKDNNSLILNITNRNKFICLQKCLMISYCLYVQYERNNCSLYTQDALKNNLNSTSVKTVYEKKKFNFQEGDTDNINQIESNGTCLNSSEFWSLKTNSCKPCISGFLKYSEISFLCYHIQTGLKNFSGSKLYCQSKGGILFRPKTQNERYLFVQKFPLKTAFVDSQIKIRGEIYKWPDGKSVIGFSPLEPNYGPIFSLMENSLIISANGFFSDVSGNNNYDLTICQYD
ncbi:unnamed protein product [Brachionus calyciflorus]|uniref:C-type lectin domain-containing protein n=1 Tax=Brachionus calyciflorus TaxID=104777 RepID=A0A814MQ92_9BILA|nr:unnamed protein product [Brachionus calyciflorus]